MGELYELIKKHGGSLSMKQLEKENSGMAKDLKKLASEHVKKEKEALK